MDVYWSVVVRQPNSGIDVGPGFGQFLAMTSIGERCTLRINREKPFGWYLDGGDLGEVLLPRGEGLPELAVGGEVEVFIHLDSEDRPVATTRRPKVMPGALGVLKCVQVNPVGAFLDWGLSKELLVPYREQRRRMVPGRAYLVHVHVDSVSGRIVASARVERYLEPAKADMRLGQAVDLWVLERTPLGYKVAVEGCYVGMLFAGEVFQPLSAGERLTGYVVKVRPDGKLDVSLHAPGRGKVEETAERIVAELQARGGFWGISDATDAAEIHAELGVSKRTFKQAIGALLRQRQIVQDERGIRLVARPG